MSPGVYGIASADNRSNKNKGVISDQSSVSWPFGILGTLNVPAGTTILTAGQTYDYDTITIQAGGSLQFQGGDGTTPSILGVKTLLSIAATGEIRSQRGTSTSGGTFTSTAPDGEIISYTITPNTFGGDGGIDGGFNPNGVGSVVGGGGGGGPTGSDGGADGSGGIGGAGVPGAPIRGAAGILYGGSGGDGGAATGSATVVDGSGGGGGAKGYHGGGLYIKVAGISSGTGSVICSGAFGGNGGNGGNSTNNKASGLRYSWGGGGGGGGSGGQGGAIKGRFKSAIPSWTFSIAGGSGGGAGNGGIASGAVGVPLTDGSVGNIGSAGHVGSTDTATY